MQAPSSDPKALVRPDATLFYADAQGVRDTIDASVQTMHGAVHTVVLDLDANDEVDITGADILNKLTESLERRHVPLTTSSPTSRPPSRGRARRKRDDFGGAHATSLPGNTTIPPRVMREVERHTKLISRARASASSNNTVPGCSPAAEDGRLAL